jgi:flagellar motor switch protein FliG
MTMTVPTSREADIAAALAALSSEGRINAEAANGLTGPQRAGVLLLSLGDKISSRIWKMLDDEEIRQLSIAMSQLGPISSDVVEALLLEFVGRLSSAGGLTGNFDATERLLSQFMPHERVQLLMEEIRGPAGRNMWEKLSNVQEQVLANYLKNEYPQTVAVVLSKIKAEHAGRVLAILPEEFALDVVGRMLKMEAIQKDVLERIEQTLRTEFMSNLSQTSRRDSHEAMAEIFNSFDRQTETRFLTALEEHNRESAERIKNLMFTFDDLAKLDSGSAQTLVRQVDKDKLAVALKGATQTMRDFFLKQMSTRAAKMLQDDMQALGPIRLKDVDEAQSILVNLAKDLAAKGEIMITKNRADDELVF